VTHSATLPARRKGGEKGMSQEKEVDRDRLERHLERLKSGDDPR
jgi:hypothetical protein